MVNTHMDVAEELVHPDHVSEPFNDNELSGFESLDDLNDFFAKFDAGDITNPAVMQPPEFESAIRGPLSDGATTALRSLCCGLYGTCATAKSAARATLQTHTPSHVASFLLSGKEFTLWA